LDLTRVKKRGVTSLWSSTTNTGTALLFIAFSVRTLENKLPLSPVRTLETVQS
jgi:hypothetical protein